MFSVCVYMCVCCVVYLTSFPAISDRGNVGAESKTRTAL